MSDENDTKKCEFCGAENKNIEYFCKECGKSLAANYKQTQEKNDANKKETKSKNKMCSSTLELAIYSVIVFIISATVVFSIPSIMGDAINNVDGFVNQLYKIIIVTGQETSIAISIIFVFIVWSIFKFNRLEKRIIETQEIIKLRISSDKSQDLDKGIKEFEKNINKQNKKDFLIFVIAVILLLAYGLFVLMYRFG